MLDKGNDGIGLVWEAESWEKRERESKLPEKMEKGEMK